MNKIIAISEPYDESIISLLEIDDTINIEETFQTFHDKFAASLPLKPIFNATITLDKHEANKHAWLTTVTQMERDLLEKCDCMQPFSHYDFHLAFIGFLIKEHGAKHIRPTEITLPTVTYRDEK